MTLIWEVLTESVYVFMGAKLYEEGRNRHCVKSVQMRGFFWSIFPCIGTEYGDLRSKSPCSVRMQGNTDQKKIRFGTLFTQCEENYRITFYTFNRSVFASKLPGRLRSYRNSIYD